MAQPYSQLRAMLAITMASLRATFRSPQSVFFGLFFPIVLIFIFGSLGKGGGGIGTVDVAWEKGSDTINRVYQQLSGLPGLHFTRKDDFNDELKKGRITAVLRVTEKGEDLYDLTVRSSTASQKDLPRLLTILNSLNYETGRLLRPDPKTMVTLSYKVEQGSRPYRMIDFFLPGMIGFSLLGTAVFGVAFLFFSLRETLVLKRLYSTPVKRSYIILGEGISKVIYQLMTVIMLILFGHFAYGFHLAHGGITVVNMLLISLLALLVFMGFGFFFSSVAKNQNLIPIYANLFMFPQYFLSGTFFQKSVLPAYMQPFLKFLPLTAVNDALRNVAFEGASLASCWSELLILLGWGVLIYAITIKVFRWD